MVSFVFSANQKAFVICTRVTHFAFVLQKSCTPFSANQHWVIFSCILLKEKITITDQLSEKCKNYVQTMYNVDGEHEWFKDSFYDFISVLAREKSECHFPSRMSVRNFWQCGRGAINCKWIYLELVITLFACNICENIRHLLGDKSTKKIPIRADSDWTQLYRDS